MGVGQALYWRVRTDSETSGFPTVVVAVPASKSLSRQRRLWVLLAALAPHVASQAAEPRTILDLQPNAAANTLRAGTGGQVRLTNLNPDFNVWYLLTIDRHADADCCIYHLENPDPGRFTYRLVPGFRSGVVVTADGDEYRCRLWDETTLAPRFAHDPSKSFQALCGGRMLLRSPTEGKATTREFVADFLRRHVWRGEAITDLVKDYLYKDRFLITSPVSRAAAGQDMPEGDSRSRPRRARVDDRYRGVTLAAKELGIELTEADPTAVGAGRWYTARASDHIFVSVIQPDLIDHALLQTHTDRVRPLDTVEATASVYLLAFDLHRFDVDFALGTLHPSPEWSYRAPAHYKASDQPGPDGIDDYQPLVMVGKVNPVKAPRVIATFAGGFKRTHGAFKWGQLSQINQASHYGFRVNGITFSTLQPHLATLLIYRDGRVDMQTWSDQLERDLPQILHARQNGVPIIEWDARSGQSIPGDYVNDWGRGNWSGSPQSEQRTLRAAACLQQTDTRSFLIYAYFSAATPSAMARVLQAYACRYAMHLDMNALEHTYSAVYLKQNQQFIIQHLNTGMNVLDRKDKESGAIVPRFVGSADNRDFFYVMEKE